MTDNHRARFCEGTADDPLGCEEGEYFVRFYPLATDDRPWFVHTNADDPDAEYAFDTPFRARTKEHALRVADAMMTEEPR